MLSYENIVLLIHKATFFEQK